MKHLPTLIRKSTLIAVCLLSSLSAFAGGPGSRGGNIILSDDKLSIVDMRTDARSIVATLNTESEGKTEFVLTNGNGQTVRKGAMLLEKGINFVKLELKEELPRGLYFLKVKEQGKTVSRPVVL